MKKPGSALVVLLLTLGALWVTGRMFYRDVPLRTELRIKAQKHARALSERLLFFPTKSRETRAFGTVKVGLDEVVRGLSAPSVLTVLPRPLGIAVVGERRGRISRVDRRGILIRWLDVATASDGPHDGLLALAFHPAFPENGKLALAYTANDDGRRLLRVAEYRVTDPRSSLEETPSFVRDLLVLERTSPEGTGCALAFDPAGRLYIALGDHLTGPGPRELARTLLRVELRSDSDGPAASPYGIPPDNPFFGQADGALDEVFATGPRRPVQLTAEEGGSLLLTDETPDGRQALWRISARAHLGGDSPSAACDSVHPCPVPEPLLAYPRSIGSELHGPAIMGRVPPMQLTGHAIVGDAKSGQLLAVPLSGQRRTLSLGAWPIRPTALASDTSGQVLIADEAAGAIYRLKRPQAHWTDGFPQIFESVEDLTGL